MTGYTLNLGRLDLAGPIDPPPVVFHAIRVPCACGRSLDGAIHTFFPSTIFARGVCPVCGPQTAIFAPGMESVIAQGLMLKFLAFLHQEAQLAP